MTFEIMAIIMSGHVTKSQQTSVSFCPYGMTHNSYSFPSNSCFSQNRCMLSQYKQLLPLTIQTHVSLYIQNSWSDQAHVSQEADVYETYCSIHIKTADS